MHDTAAAQCPALAVKRHENVKRAIDAPKWVAAPSTPSTHNPHSIHGKGRGVSVGNGGGDANLKIS